MPEANPDRPHGNSSTYGRESGKNSTAGISSSAFTPSPSTVMPGRSRHSSHAFFAAAANGMSTAACTAQKFWKRSRDAEQQHAQQRREKSVRRYQHHAHPQQRKLGQSAQKIAHRILPQRRTEIGPHVVRHITRHIDRAARHGGSSRTEGHDRQTAQQKQYIQLDELPELPRKGLSDPCSAGFFRCILGNARTFLQIGWTKHRFSSCQNAIARSVCLSNKWMRLISTAAVMVSPA